MTSTPRRTWVSPQLLRAECITVDGAFAAGDQWLRPGTHLRVLPDQALGYPLCPFTVWRAGFANFVNAIPGPALYTAPGSDESNTVVAALATTDDGPLSVGDAALRRRAVRARSPQIVGAVPVPWASYEGTGDLRLANYVQGLSIDDANGQPIVPAWVNDPPIDAIGAPFPRGPWWTGIDPAFRSADQTYRVRAGVKNTALPFGPDQPADALARAAASAALLEADIAAAWAGAPPEGHPGMASISHDLDGSDYTWGALARKTQRASASLDLLLALWAACADPAVARWWGFATTLDEKVQPSIDGVECFAVAAAWALPTGSDRSRENLKLAIMQQDDPMAAPMLAALEKAHPTLAHTASELTDAGLDVVCLWTIAPAVVPPDQPATPVLDVPIDKRQWNIDGTWAATVTMADHIQGPVAFRREPDAPLNQPLAAGEPWRRPVIAGTDRDTSVSTVTDTSSPTGPNTWTLQVADVWGRWSAPASVTSDPPELPPVPKPNGSLAVKFAAPAGDAGARSPGDVIVTALVQSPASYAPAIASVVADLVGAQSPVVLELTPDGRWTGTTPVDPTHPGDSRDVACTVTVTDAGARSATDDKPHVVVNDPRAIVVPATSPVLLFTGPRRPDGRAELDVSLPAPATPSGVTWKLYGTDEQALPDSPAIAEPRWSRANRLRTQIAASNSRTSFSPVADASIALDGAHLRIRAQLPGRMRTVQLFQLAPTTAGGIESPSSTCGSFAVAVPFDDAPPSPMIKAKAEPAQPRTVTLTVSLAYPGTRGADDAPPLPVALRSGSGASVLRARIRRSAVDAAPGGSPIVAVVGLAPAHPADRTLGWRWQATYTDTLPATAPAYAKLTYFAEAAWPDEPAWDPGAAPVYGEVRTTWPHPGPQQSEWSSPSDPVTATAVEPLLQVHPTWTAAGPGRATISVPVPVAHERAAYWRMTVGGAGLASADQAGPGPDLSIEVDDAPGAAAWRIVVIAPDGTPSPVVAADGSVPV